MFAANSFAVATDNAMVLAARMSNPYGAVAYATTGNPDDITIGGRGVPAGGGQIGVQFLRLDAAVAAMLAAFASSGLTPDGSEVDVGSFTTAISSAGATAGDNAYSLPSNFGPGRDNWVTADLSRVECRIEHAVTTFGGAGVGGHAPTFYRPTIVAGNLRVFIKNNSPTTLIQLGVTFRYRHSLEG